jgi:hypothetical protein
VKPGTEEHTPEEHQQEGPEPHSSVRGYWSSIPIGLRLLLIVEVGVLAGTVGYAGLASSSGNTIPPVVFELELFLLAFTIVVLTLLTEYTMRTSSKDIHLLIETVRAENRALIDENRAHWSEQRTHLDGLVKTLTQLTELQAELITAVRRLDEAQRATIDSQKADMKAREEALQKEIEKHKPALDIRIGKWDGKVIKHFKAFVSNHGPPGLDLDVTFSVGGFGASEHFTMVSQGGPCEMDFGDIDQYPDSGEIVVIAEVSGGTRSHRYRFVASYDYHRNKGFWGSSPTLARKSPEVLPAQVLY